MKKYYFILIIIFMFTGCFEGTVEVKKENQESKKVNTIDVSVCVKPDMLMYSCDDRTEKCIKTQFVELTEYNTKLRIYIQCLEDNINMYNDELTKKSLFTLK